MSSRIQPRTSCHCAVLAVLGACGGSVAGGTASTDAGTRPDVDAGAEDSSGANILAPRPIAPLSTATTTSQSPTLRWALSPGTDGAQIDLCRDRSCASPVATFAASGTSASPPSALASGVYFWRLRGLSNGVVGAHISPVWEFSVGARSAPVDTSWGTSPDVNGDGYSDFLVGAFDDSASVGHAYVYLGGAAGPGASPAATLNDPGGGGSHFGESLASAGDVNGDGYADVVVAAWNGSTVEGAGRAYVFFGGPDGLALSPASTLSDPAGGNGYGSSVASAGDVNGDGYSDVVVASYCTGPCPGVVYLYFGSGTGLDTSPAATISLFDATTSYVPWVTAASAGDVNGDGFADVVVGGGDAQSAGVVQIYVGGVGGLPAVPATVIASPATTQGEFGSAVAGAGDIDGDGFADVLVGAGNGTIGTGGAYLYLGGANGTATSAATVLLAPPGTGGDFGYAASTAGDVNGDGFVDIVVGAGAGVAYVFLGSSSGLSTTSSTIGDPTADYHFGFEVANAGDVNGDGFADIGVGTGGGTATSEGRAFLYLGSVSGPQATPAATFTSPSGGDGFGRAVARVDEPRSTRGLP